MKVAVCYSGLYRHFKGWVNNHKKITDFADSVYYSTWEGAPTEPPFDHVKFPEPVVDYDPYSVPLVQERWPRIYNAYQGSPRGKWLTKQIIAHQLICDHIADKGYDVIVRLRYDIWLGNHDWKSMIEKVYNENIVISFGGWSGQFDTQPNVCEQLVEPSRKNGGLKMEGRILDFANIHPANKMKGTMDLHNNKQLCCATMGFTQVLGDPYPEQPINYGGGVMLTRYRTDQPNTHKPGTTL